MNDQPISDGPAGTATRRKPAGGTEMFLDGSLPPLIVRASAGTGKTYRLTARLLQILLQGAPPESILATTFTRKAAGEILERVLMTLAKAADGDNPDALEELRQQTGIKQLSRNACLQLLSKLVANIHRVRICTLDSLFTQLAKSFPFELRLPPTWRLTDEIEEVWLRERAVDAVVASLDASELATLLSMLSKGETKRSVTRELVQIVSGTYSLSRLAPGDAWEQLDAPTAPDGNVLTDAAATLRNCEPPQKRIQDKLAAWSELIDAREFDPLVKDTLIRNYAKAKREGSPVKFGTSKLPDGIDDALGAAYAATRSRALALLASQNSATGQILALYDAQINQQKQAMRSLGFEDIAVRLAKQFSPVDQQLVNRRMDGAIDHLLLDEFQDTSPAQWQVLRPFAIRVASPERDADPASDRPTSKSFFCVGDTKQAIYGWRGGVAEIFDTVDREIDNVVPVEQNISFRSSPVVIETVNRVFKNLSRHAMAASDPNDKSVDRDRFGARAVRAFADRFPQHHAHHSDLPGLVRLETVEMTSEKRSSEKTQKVFGIAARRIAELNEAAPAKSIGVLTRTNRAVADLIYLLEQHGVDVSQEGGNPLVDSAAVDLLLSALMMTEHPGDGRWKYHVENSPLAGKVCEQRVRSWIGDLGLSRTVNRLAGLIAPDCDARDRIRLKQLTQLTVSYEPNATSRLRDFVRMVREKRVERPQAAPVRVMTVHQSKGLEFDAVFLPELDGQLSVSTPLCVADVPDVSEPPVAISRFLSSDAWHFLDSRWQNAFGSDVESKTTESLCLLYVAMTRARQALYMLCQPTKLEDRKPSALIRAALAADPRPSDQENVLYEVGDREWYA